MERHLLAAVCIALVATTAGCNASLGTGTATPTPTAPGPELAPGVPAVEANGTASVETDRLRAANARLRANTSYTVVRTVTVTDGDGNGTLGFERTLLVTPEGTLERLDIEQSGQFSAVIDNGTRWTDASGTWTRTTLSNDRTTTTERLASDPEPYGYGDDLLRRTLAAESYRVRNDSDGVVLSTRDIDLDSEALLPLSTGPPIDERVRVVLAESGLVRSLAVRYDAVYGIQTVTVTIRHDLRDVGATTAERPAWVPADG